MQMVELKSVLEVFVLMDGRYLLHRSKDGVSETTIMTKERFEKFQKENNLIQINQPTMSVGTFPLTSGTLGGVSKTSGKLEDTIIMKSGCTLDINKLGPSITDSSATVWAKAEDLEAAIKTVAATSAPKEKKKPK